MLAFFSPGPLELCIIGGIAILLFGSRLPKVARGLGQSIVEFKRGIKGIQEPLDDMKDEINTASRELNKEVNKVKDAVKV